MFSVDRNLAAAVGRAYEGLPTLRVLCLSRRVVNKTYAKLHVALISGWNHR